MRALRVAAILLVCAVVGAGERVADLIPVPVVIGGLALGGLAWMTAPLWEHRCSRS